MARCRICSAACLVAALLAGLTVPISQAATPRLIGEFGQEVLGCQCKGKTTTHGYCGYHFHLGSDEGEPWCRTKYGCGNSTIRGSWAFCDARGVERRRAGDGKLYTAKEFKEYFGSEGRDAWVAAEAHIEKRLARNKRPYTVYEFRDYYVDALGEHGWLAEWAAAAGERRRAHDGAWQTWDEFATYYGDRARTTWAEARAALKEL